MFFILCLFDQVKAVAIDTILVTYNLCCCKYRSSLFTQLPVSCSSRLSSEASCCTGSITCSPISNPIYCFVVKISSQQKGTRWAKLPKIVFKEMIKQCSIRFECQLLACYKRKRYIYIYLVVYYRKIRLIYLLNSICVCDRG